jgi:aminopeptidase N
MIRPLTPLAFALTLLAANPRATDTYPRQPGVDAEHYRFALTLGDSTDEMQGEATVSIRFTRDGLRDFFLDLATPAAGKGMTVTAVSADSAPLRYTHADRRLRITLATPTRAGELRRFTIRYHGVPANGLRTGLNRYRERCFFSWNWPDKAREWLPMIDHPGDKATSEFVVTAPAKYAVVANGLLQEETLLGDGRKVTHWKQTVPIASWLNAIGVEQFGVHHAGLVRGVELQTWVPHQDLAKGVAAFEEPARRALEFYSDHVGPYAYEKLANVSAAFDRGGTEHVSAIFYGEDVIDRNATGIVAHEVAHQWFGDAVTEGDWDDAWLSEGFATYFALLYTEHYDGRDAFVAGLQRARTTALAAEQRLNEPVVHDNIDDLAGVIPPLVYQKGAWVLHMLRAQVGTETFWAGIRAYYRRYRDANASTDDLRRVMEEASGQDLQWFFAQWLHRNWSPRLSGTWRYDAASHQVVIELTQGQRGDAYRLPLEVAITPDSAGAAPRVVRVEMTQQAQRFEINEARAPREVVLDPGTWVLMEPPAFRKR